ncbi:MAG TPA: SMP-30/gluconolactonase/LRE family protein [Myxococcota bacterium]|nr:SMP-30/gluconolactonase/LRE family protein [Myxococcota bacterium]
MSRVNWGAVIGVLLGPLLYLLTWPTAIDPVAWYPDSAPALEGVYAPNTRLAGAELLSLGEARGGEDVVVDARGRVFTGVEDGRILRFDPGASAPVVHAETGGRPLGMALTADGRIAVADGERGLLLIDGEGAVEALDVYAEGAPLSFADDVEVGPDNVAYVTDVSPKFGFNEYTLEILEGRPNGRVVAVDLETQRTRQVRGDLFFPNGVALDPEGRFVLVCETSRYRVVRVWLGDREGEGDVFAANLPGFPDGITGDGHGSFWVAIVNPRNTMVDLLAPWPFMRRVVTRLPSALRPGPARSGMVLRLDGEGRVVEQLGDPEGATIGHVSSAEPFGDWLYLGTLGEPVIARLRLAPTGG